MNLQYLVYFNVKQLIQSHNIDVHKKGGHHCLHRSKNASIFIKLHHCRREVVLKVIPPANQ
jgi:hypothetical protein